MRWCRGIVLARAKKKRLEDLAAEPQILLDEMVSVESMLRQSPPALAEAQRHVESLLERCCDSSELKSGTYLQDILLMTASDLNRLMCVLQYMLKEKFKNL